LMQSTKTGELRWFPNPEALIQFLRNEFGGCEEIGDLSRSVAQDAKTTPPEKDRRAPGKRSMGHSAGE
jgi:hypothetical protein